MSFAELYPALPKGALIGTVEDPKWRRLWEMADAEAFALAG
jgi:hypothetical protein